MTNEEIMNDDGFISDSSSVDIDEVSKVPVTILPDAPIPLGGLNNWLKQGRNLKFEVNPIDNSGIIYISSNEDKIGDSEKLFPEESKLYDFKIPDSITDESEEYNNYLKNCFKNFEDLIKDKTYQNFIISKNEETSKIGVILEEDVVSRNVRNQENQVLLNSTISKLILDLSILIDEKLSSQESPDDPDFKLIQLEETINVLSLINALFFSTTDELLILLVNWVNRADIQPDLEFTEEILSVDKPYKHSLFWTEYTKKLIARGLFAQALNVIRESKYELLEDEDNDLFLVIEDLIVLLSNYDTVEFSLNNRSFVTWKQKCCELRENFKNLDIRNSENISIKNSIYEILLIMTGLSSSIIKSSTSWYECLLTKYLFELPCDSSINEYLEDSLAHFPIDEFDSLTWERTCIDLIHGNYLKVVKNLELLDKPTSTYVSVLFEARGLYNSYDFLLSSKNNDDDETISELLLNDHALECLCHQKLIPIGVGILINLNTSITRSVISQYLPKFNCMTNDDLEWCLSICAKLKLNSTLSTILKINGNKLFDQGQLYESLVLYSKSGDLKILNDKCWLIFENAIVKSDKITDELINSLILSNETLQEEFEIADSLRQCLSPYAIFLIFLDLKKQNNFTKLVNYLLNLLNFKYLPKKYFPLLLCQLLPFLKNLSPTSSKIDLNPSNEQVISQENLIRTLDLITKYETSFLKLYNAALLTAKPTIEQQSYINQFENTQDLYKLAISEGYKTQVEDKHYDWRYQLELIDDSLKLPETIEELLLYIREKISLQIGWCFLDDQ